MLRSSAPTFLIWCSDGAMRKFCTAWPRGSQAAIARERAILNLLEDFLHFLLRLFRDDARLTMVAALRRIGQDPAHLFVMPPS